MPYTQEKTILNSSDKKRLLKAVFLIPIIFGSIFGLAILTIGWGNVKIFFTQGFADGEVLTYVVSGVSVLFPMAILFMTFSFLKDYLNGKKMVIRGIVTDKKFVNMDSNSKNSTAKHVIYLDELEFEIDKINFERIKTKDEVEIQITPSNFILKIEILNIT